MRKFLDRLYNAAGYLAAFFMIGVLAMVLASVVGRLAGFNLRGSDAYAGYCMAAASFLALAGTLKAGTHIRVTMLLGALGDGARRLLEIWAFGLAMLASAYMTWQLASFAWVSYLFHDVSPGVVRVPLWIPQAAMALGAAILTVALADELVTVVYRGRPSFRAAEDAVTLGKEA